jgi:NAD(P)H-dependent flavin oxidoreductase YrpB (nitropropane dioxygenase family)
MWFKTLDILGKQLIPIVQGGMGVGVSAHRLAGAVAREFCIDLKLVSALKGDVQKGLFFRGAGVLPFGKAVRSVRELIEYLLCGTVPLA